MSMLEAVKQDSGNFITPRGRMLYPALFRPQLPQGETDEKKAKYQCTLLIPAKASLTVLHRAVKEILEEEWTEAVRKKSKIRLPFLKTEDQARFVEYADEFPYMLRCNSTVRPDVVSPSGQSTISEEDEADEVYGGRWARMSVRPFAYDHPQGGKGVSLGLQNVQVLDHDEAIAGGRVRGTSEFSPVSEDLDDELEGLA